MKKKILALDLGTKTGWALHDGDLIISGTQSFKPQRFEGGGMRFLKFKSWLEKIVELSGGLDLVNFEEVRRHAGVDAAHAYGGFMATLTSWCEAKGIPYTGIPVGTIKKHATGRGNAGKKEMIEAAVAKGHTPDDDNEADAIHILYYALEGDTKWLKA